MIGIGAKTHGSDSVKHAAQLIEISTACLELKEFSLAIANLRLAIKIHTSAGFPSVASDHSVAGLWQQLGSVHAAAGEWTEAADAYGCEFTLREAAPAANIEELISAGERRLRMLSRLKRGDEADRLNEVLVRLRHKLQWRVP